MEERILDWIAEDRPRLEALACAAELRLPDWCLAAGFVRNLVWDRLHGYADPTPLHDLDLVYFDGTDTRAEKDLDYEARLHTRSPLPWSVKNQARMHWRNGDDAYHSTADAMCHWVEIETAVGVRFDENGHLMLVAPLGVETLLAGSVSLNPNRPKPETFKRRIEEKRWLETWPALKIVGQQRPAVTAAHDCPTTIQATTRPRPTT